MWCQILADVTGVPTTRSVDAEIGAKGAFLVALVALGDEQRMSDAVASYVHARDTFEPDPGANAAYERLYEGYISTGRTMATEWPTLAVLRSTLSLDTTDGVEVVS